jgi:hypothetical protein
MLWSLEEITCVLDVSAVSIFRINTYPDKESSLDIFFQSTGRIAQNTLT